MSKKRKRKHDMPATCEECDLCIYIGEGTFICESSQEVVIEEWMPLRMPSKECAE